MAATRRRLFVLGILALFTAAFSAALRSAVAASLKAEWIDPVAAARSGEMIGTALGSSFLGFAVTLLIASALLDVVGIRRTLVGCALCFLIGTALIAGAGLLATGLSVYRVAVAGMVLSGIGWGLAEAAINPLTTRLYPDDATHRLNVLHAWFPGGLIVGGLAGVSLASIVPWQAIMALVLLPAAGVLAIAATTRFPEAAELAPAGGSMAMLDGIVRRPSILVWFAAMLLTAASELAPGQWIDVALSNRVGIRGILLLVYVSALMFVFRHFVGRLAQRLSNPGLLWVSSLLAAIGLYLLSRAQSPAAALLASTVWGLGVCAMWPTMLASVAERYPRGGALALGLMGASGALASFIVLPRLGAMFDAAKRDAAGGPAELARLSGDALRQVEDIAASVSFARLALVPVVLLGVFGAIWFHERRQGPRRTRVASRAR